MKVKRQVWEADLELFRKQIFPLFKKYLNGPGPKINFFLGFMEPKKRRDANQTLDELGDVIGSSFVLYDSLLHFARTLYIKTAQLKFCTWRYEMLMWLHDHKVNKLFDFDPVHQICVLFEQWIRNGDTDQKRLKLLWSIMSTNDKPLYGEVSMVCAAPMVSNCIQKGILNLLELKAADSPLFNEGFLVVLVQLLRSTQNVVEILQNIQPFAPLSYSEKDLIQNLVDMMKSQHLDETIAHKLINLFSGDFVARKIILMTLPKWLNRKEEKKFISIWKPLVKDPNSTSFSLISQEESFLTTMTTYDPTSPFYPLFSSDLNQLKKK